MALALSPLATASPNTCNQSDVLIIERGICIQINKPKQVCSLVYSSCSTLVNNNQVDMDNNNNNNNGNNSIYNITFKWMDKPWYRRAGVARLVV